MYEMNAKMILLEYKSAGLDDPLAKLNSMQDKYDKLCDQNVRRASEMQKLR